MGIELHWMVAPTGKLDSFALALLGCAVLLLRLSSHFVVTTAARGPQSVSLTVFTVEQVLQPKLALRLIPHVSECVGHDAFIGVEGLSF